MGLSSRMHTELPWTLSFQPLLPRGPEATKLGTVLHAAHQRASGTQGRPQDRAGVSPAPGLPAFSFPMTPLSEMTWPAPLGLHVRASSRHRSGWLQNRPLRPRKPNDAHLHTHVCAHIHVHKHTCTHACGCSHMHTHACVQSTCTHACTQGCACMCVHNPMSTHTCVYTCAHVCVQSTCAPACTQACTHTGPHGRYIGTNTPKHTCLYTYMHMCLHEHAAMHSHTHVHTGTHVCPQVCTHVNMHSHKHTVHTHRS